MILLSWLAAWLALSAAGLGLWNLALYRPPERTAGVRPAMSVLVPARNEAANIGDALAAIRANADVDLDIVVLDDHSTDDTAAIVRAIAAEDPRVRLVAGAPLPAGWSGKQHACWSLAAEARHDLLLFVDADVRLTADALGRIAGFMAERPAVGLASGVPREETETLSERLLLSLIPFLLLAFLPMAGMRRSLSPGFGAGCGQLFVARRAAYQAAGGHAAIRRSLHDGVTLPRAFRRAGQMTDLFDAAPIARCRMYRGWPEVLSGLSKNATEGLATPVALPVWTLLLGLGQVLPPLLLLLTAIGPAGIWGWAPAAVAVVASIGFRLVLAARFRSTWTGAILHPLGVALLLAIQWRALVRARRGRTEDWRGRSYPAA